MAGLVRDLDPTRRNREAPLPNVRSTRKVMSPEATAEARTAESRKRPWMAGLIRDPDPTRRTRKWHSMDLQLN
jgi:hypothetical protein